MDSVVVTGATSIIGHFLLPKLVSNPEWKVIAVSRQKQKIDGDSIIWKQRNLLSPAIDFGESRYTLIHLAPIWTLPDMLQTLAVKPSRVIAFSSTSRFSKAESRLSSERTIACKLISGELRLQAWCEEQSIPWTILRPTLVYGAGMDKNVSSIATFITRFGFFPVVGKGEGLRMPVHADDLASAVVCTLESSKTENQAYNLSGGSIVSYKEMVTAVSEGLGSKATILSLPKRVAEMVVSIAKRIPRYEHLNTAMLSRMSDDLVYKSDKAKSHFNYSPRRFSPRSNDLGK